MPLPPTPMQIVALDLIGPFVASSKNNKYVLTIIDHCSGWAEAYPIPDKRSQTIEHYFHNRFVPSHGCPEVVISDNGAEFTAKHWTAYLKKMGIEHRRCTPRGPRGLHIILTPYKCFRCDPLLPFLLAIRPPAPSSTLEVATCAGSHTRIRG